MRVDACGGKAFVKQVLNPPQLGLVNFLLEKPTFLGSTGGFRQGTRRSFILLPEWETDSASRSRFPKSMYLEHCKDFLLHHDEITVQSLCHELFVNTPVHGAAGSLTHACTLTIAMDLLSSVLPILSLRNHIYEYLSRTRVEYWKILLDMLLDEKQDLP